MGVGREEPIKIAAQLVRLHPDTLARWCRAGLVVARQFPPRPRRRRGGSRWTVAVAPSPHGGWMLVRPA